MLQLNKITITQFKNYALAAFDFTERVVGICGLNGKGKTNLLDAIYYCCFTKSYFSKTDALTVQFDKEGFRLEALLEKQNKEQKQVSRRDINSRGRERERDRRSRECREKHTKTQNHQARRTSPL